jgi:hypothetical protein
VNECIRTNGGTNLTEEDRSFGTITWPIATLSTERLVFLSETRRCHNTEDPNMVTHCPDTVKLCVVEEQHRWFAFVRRGVVRVKLGADEELIRQMVVSCIVSSRPISFHLTPRILTSK